MGKCINHPDQETRYVCMKHDVYLCEDCQVCRDPELYCKFRTSCPIWFVHKERRREERQQRSESFEKIGPVSDNRINP